MTTKTITVVMLTLGPAAAAWLAGFGAASPYLALGAVLAIKLGVQARPAAGFALLLPVLYLAAAVTASSTDAVAALVVALAAAIGAAASLGLHRGLVALLAAALLGSFRPAVATGLLAESGWLLAGATYGWLISATLLRSVDLPATRVDGQNALGYAMLLACVTLVAWFAARVGGFDHPWWLPLTVVAVSEPRPEPTALRALLRTVLAATAALVLVWVTDVFESPGARIVLLLPLLVTGISIGWRRRPIAAVFLAPVLLLLSGQPASHEPPLDYLLACLAAFVPVLAVSSVGHWAYWTLRVAPRRVAARAESGSA
jgi:hypothetical protein